MHSKLRVVLAFLASVDGYICDPACSVLLEDMRFWAFPHLIRMESQSVHTVTEWFGFLSQLIHKVIAPVRSRYIDLQ